MRSLFVSLPILHLLSFTGSIRCCKAGYASSAILWDWCWRSQSVSTHLVCSLVTERWNRCHGLYIIVLVDCLWWALRCAAVFIQRSMFLGSMIFFLFLKNNQISLWAVACGSRYMTNIIKMSPPTTLPHTCCHAISLYLQFGIFDLCHCCEYPSLFSCLRAVAGGKLGGTTTTRKQQLVCCARRRILYIIYDVVSLCIDFLLFHSSMLQ
jgi:hypothetical protein